MEGKFLQLSEKFDHVLEEMARSRRDMELLQAAVGVNSPAQPINLPNPQIQAFQPNPLHNNTGASTPPPAMGASIPPPATGPFPGKILKI